MEEEEKVSKKLMISCREASFLNTIKEVDSLSLYQRLQLGIHSAICEVCKVWNKQSAQINKLIKSAFSGEEHKLPDEKKKEIEKELDELFI